MPVHPQFDPIALQLGPLAVRWYGLMYLIGFGLIWIVGRARIARFPGGVWTANDLGDAIFYGISALFLIGYGVFRFSVEYSREPDSYLGLLAFGLSMGQWLSLPMIAAGGALLAWSHRNVPHRPT